MFPGKFDFDFFLDDLKESKTKSLVHSLLLKLISLIRQRKK